ncbi:hypothetical protein FZEAL_10554 [Fusarium zealandicum]|uniref:Uncharacterized protein n=1 Tax=Fusarium zealandicum TaxID=1053134 RepID=A0A8H4XAI0_9HYPO|nr:hypothetical protein FZEAL_10554 [Fusarium zealandicum]
MGQNTQDGPPPDPAVDQAHSWLQVSKGTKLTPAEEVILSRLEFVAKQNAAVLRNQKAIIVGIEEIAANTAPATPDAALKGPILYSNCKFDTEKAFIDWLGTRQEMAYFRDAFGRFQAFSNLPYTQYDYNKEAEEEAVKFIDKAITELNCQIEGNPSAAALLIELYSLNGRTKTVIFVTVCRMFWNEQLHVRAGNLYKAAKLN